VDRSRVKVTGGATDVADVERAATVPKLVWSAACLAVVLAALVAGVVLNRGTAQADRQPGVPVGRADFAEWPFSVDTGTLRCEEGGAVIFESGGVSYFLNGPAREAGYTMPWAIWEDSDDPAEAAVGMKKSSVELLDRGEALCFRPQPGQEME
jgi:hypothetical protein